MITQIKLYNLGTVNKNEIRILTDRGKFYLTFSYLTLVGISWDWHNKGKWESGKATIENYWSTTTGKLLNELEPDKKKRLKDDDFQKEVDKMFKFLNK